MEPSKPLQVEQKKPMKAITYSTRAYTLHFFGGSLSMASAMASEPEMTLISAIVLGSCVLSVYLVYSAMVDARHDPIRCY